MRRSLVALTSAALVLGTGACVSKKGGDKDKGSSGSSSMSSPDEAMPPEPGADAAAKVDRATLAADASELMTRYADTAPSDTEVGPLVDAVKEAATLTPQQWETALSEVTPETKEVVAEEIQKQAMASGKTFTAGEISGLAAGATLIVAGGAFAAMGPGAIKSFTAQRSLEAYRNRTPNAVKVDARFQETEAALEARLKAQKVAYVPQKVRTALGNVSNSMDSIAKRMSDFETGRTFTAVKKGFFGGQTKVTGNLVGLFSLKRKPFPTGEMFVIEVNKSVASKMNNVDVAAFEKEANRYLAGDLKRLNGSWQTVLAEAKGKPATSWWGTYGQLTDSFKSGKSAVDIKGAASNVKGEVKRLAEVHTREYKLPAAVQENFVKSMRTEGTSIDGLRKTFKSLVETPEFKRTGVMPKSPELQTRMTAKSIETVNPNYKMHAGGIGALVALGGLATVAAIAGTHEYGLAEGGEAASDGGAMDWVAGAFEANGDLLTEVEADAGAATASL